MKLTPSEDCTKLQIEGDIVLPLIETPQSTEVQYYNISVHEDCTDDSDAILTFQVRPEHFQLNLTCLGRVVTYSVGIDSTVDSFVNEVTLADGTSLDLPFAPYTVDVLGITALTTYLQGLDEVFSASFVQAFDTFIITVETYLGLATVVTDTQTIGWSVTSSSNDATFQVELLEDILTSRAWSITAGTATFVDTGTAASTLERPVLQLQPNQTITLDVGYTINGTNVTRSFDITFDYLVAPICENINVDIVDNTLSSYETVTESCYMELQNGMLFLNSAGVNQENCPSSGAVINDGIFTVTVTSFNFADEQIEEESGCGFVNCTMKCCVADALVNDDLTDAQKQEIDVMYNAIIYSTECCRCCTAADIYCTLNDMLTNIGNCLC
jgi:hypothetical protein